MRSRCFMAGVADMGRCKGKMVGTQCEYHHAQSRLRATRDARAIAAKHKGFVNIPGGRARSIPPAQP